MRGGMSECAFCQVYPQFSILNCQLSILNCQFSILCPSVLKKGNLCFSLCFNVMRYALRVSPLPRPSQPFMISEICAPICEIRGKYNLQTVSTDPYISSMCSSSATTLRL